MARSSRRSAARRNRTGPSERQRALYKAFGIAVALVVVLTVGWVLAARGWSWLAGLEEFRVYPGQLDLRPLPWLDAEAFMADVRRTDRTGLLRGGCSYFLPRLPEKVAAAYERSPWVARVTRVSKRFPNRLDIALVIREPFALVRYNDTQVWVDREGVVLSPTIYRLEAVQPARPPVHLARAPSVPPRPGETWRVEDVSAALAMLRYIEERPVLRRLNLASIEVRREGGWFNRERLCLVLTTRDGPQILWGLPPMAAGPGTAEVDTDTKVGRLQGILRHRARLPAIEYIDVRNDIFTIKERNS